MSIRQTIVDGLYLLCGINVAPPHIYLIPAWETQTRKRPSASSLWAWSSQRETKIKTQLLHSVEPLDGSAALEYWLSGPAISRQHTSSPSAARKRATSMFESGMLKPKSPLDRDWTMQSPYINTEMGIQRGWTGSVSMWGWTDNETAAGLSHPATTLSPRRHGRV